MSGFPVRPSRSAFGPEPVNRQPVDDPERQLGADIGSLMFWQLGGLGIVAPRALVLISSLGVRLASGEAWDPRRETTAPVTAKTATGVYTLTYAASYPDELGSAITTSLLGATATVQEATALHSSCVIEASGRVVTVRVWNAAGVATDGKVLVSVF